ncbi:hypothetical protein FI667_g8940, partial [Globisporangium splendens]
MAPQAQPAQPQPPVLPPVVLQAPAASTPVVRPPVSVAPVAPPAVPVAANAAKMQSMMRGLQHMSNCHSGCTNPFLLVIRFLTLGVAFQSIGTARPALGVWSAFSNLTGIPYCPEQAATFVAKMVLEFCSGLFSTADSSRSDDDKEMKRKAAIDAVLLDCQYDAKWEKEFRVFSTAASPLGSGFNALPRFPCEDHLIAAEYNARCRSIGDYSRLINEGIRVRKINNQDAAGIPYDDVLQMMRKAMPAFFLTFADVNSKRVSSEPTDVRPDRVSVRRSQSSMSLGAGVVITRRNSTISLSNPGTGNDIIITGSRLAACRNSSSIVVMHGGAADVQENSALVSDLETKTRDVHDKLQSMEKQLADLELERDQAMSDKANLMQERDLVASMKQELEMEKLMLLEERDAIVAQNKLLTSQHQSASNLHASTLEQERRDPTKLKEELNATRGELTLLQQANSGMMKSQSSQREKISEQTQAMEEKTQAMEQLRHEKEDLELQWKELVLEHSDTAHHVEELHSRLIEAQEKCRDAELQIHSLDEELDVKTKQLAGLKQTIEAVKLNNSELDRLLRRESGTQGTSTTASNEASTDHLTLLRQLLDECTVIEQQRDELLVESSSHEQKLQIYQEKIDSLSSQNAEYEHQIASLENELHMVHSRQQALQVEFENQHLTVQQNLTSTQEELLRKIKMLESSYATEQTEKEQLRLAYAMEKAEKEQLRLALDRLEGNARAKLDAHTKEQEFLSQFKLQLMNGIVVTKYGTRGNPHSRVLFSDPGCRWISWKQPSNGGMSLASPRSDAKVETNNLVDVIPGATTEIFLRQKPDVPAKCLSLVFVHPCRTLDIEAESVEKCQFYLRGFRLLHEEVAHKRR